MSRLLKARRRKRKKLEFAGIRNACCGKHKEKSISNLDVIIKKALSSVIGLTQNDSIVGAVRFELTTSRSQSRGTVR